MIFEKSRAPGGGAPWAELKSDEHLSMITRKTHIFDAVSLTVCSSESWPESFIAGSALFFSTKRCTNPALNWALFIKSLPTFYNFDSFLFRGHRKCIEVHLSVVWKHLESGLQSSAERCVLSWAHLWVCSPLSAWHLPQTLQKQSCQNHQGLKSPCNRFFISLPYGKRFHGMMAKTERLRRRFFPQAIRLLNSNSVS